MRLLIKTLVWILSLMGIHWIGGTVKFDKARVMMEYFNLHSAVSDIIEMIHIIKQTRVDEFYAEIPTDRGTPDNFAWKKHIYYRAIKAERSMEGSVCIAGTYCKTPDEIDRALIKAAGDAIPIGTMAVVNGELVTH